MSRFEFEPRELGLFANPKSRTGRAALAKIPSEIAASIGMIELVDQDWDAVLDRAVKRGCRVIAVAGGDGSLREPAAKIADRGLVMAIVPAGTGNALARELGLPLDSTQALLATLKGGTVGPMDVGLWNGEPFLTVASVGLTSEISKQMEVSPKGLLGVLNYIPAVLQAASKAKPFRAKVVADGNEFEGLALQIVFAVTRTHGGPFQATRDASRCDGKLSGYVLKATGASGLMAFAAALSAGTHTELDTVWHFDAERGSVELDRTKPFVIDGDRSRADFATFEVLPQRLQLLVPSAPEPDQLTNL